MLKQNKCPKCEKGIASIHFFPGAIVKHPCGFQIRVIRWQQIVSSKIDSNIEDRLNKEFEEGGETYAISKR